MAQSGGGSGVPFWPLFFCLPKTSRVLQYTQHVEQPSLTPSNFAVSHSLSQASLIPSMSPSKTGLQLFVSKALGKDLLPLWEGLIPSKTSMPC